MLNIPVQADSNNEFMDEFTRLSKLVNTSYAHAMKYLKDSVDFIEDFMHVYSRNNLPEQVLPVNNFLKSPDEIEEEFKLQPQTVRSTVVTTRTATAVSNFVPVKEALLNCTEMEENY